MELIQLVDQAIDVSDWRRHEEFGEYPEGARDKTLLYCPSQAPYNFLKKDHRYLFKRSSHRYPEQFWAEILAYRLGAVMEISVPPTFVAYDSKKNLSGALIEWFLNPVTLLSDENYIPGGDYCQQYIPDFDRKKGKQHNFETVSQIFEDLSKKYIYFDDWKNFWAKTFVFDALIGNTDRHQDNWGIILTPYYGILSSEKIRIAPVFDNGTSMGSEIPSNKFSYYDDNDNLKRYVLKGWHHMKWNISDMSPAGHIEMLKKFTTRYPETRQLMINSLGKIDAHTFKNILETLMAFDVPVRLTPERAAFMLRLLQFRHQHLLHELEK